MKVFWLEVALMTMSLSLGRTREEAALVPSRLFRGGGESAC